MTNQWIFSPLTTEEEHNQKEIAEKLSICPTLAKLLVKRGITTFDEARAFFCPDLSQLHDPFLIKDMDLAVKRLNNALQKKERILIYGDYDVDGTTAVALVYTFLQQYTTSLDFYIPDRYNEGYGISKQGIDYAKEQGFTLVIALDCGIKAIEKVKYANSLGIDFIICDHHTTDNELPNAVAVLDSKRSDDTYPYKDLSGCGVGFKLMQAFAIDNNIPFSELEKLLDFVAVSIASDIVPITGENRILAHYGIKRLNEQPSVGLHSIAKICNLEKDITISDIVFKIGPRINASGRIQSGREVVELLISKDRKLADKLSHNINNYNDTRRDIDKLTTDEAKKSITLDMINTHRSIVVYKPEWHKGIVGIVASRLTEEYYKPTIVLAKANNMISGSARSVPGFDIYKAIDSCRELLENFGGHMYAAGLSMKEENLDKFIEQFEEYVSNNIKEEQLQPQIEIDAEIKFSEITPKFIRILDRFAPFGPGNMKPVFCTRELVDFNRQSKLVGRDQEHLKLDLLEQNSNVRMSGIAFRMKQYLAPLKAREPIDVCYTLENNTFNGAKNIQLMVRDIKISKEHTE